MPLPSTLLARLAKRGIVAQNTREDSEATDSCVKPILQTEVTTELNEQQNKHRKKRRRPAPPGWFRVPRSEGCHSYYWNVNTNQVSWLHPEDPDAKITMPASWVEKENDKDNSVQSSEAEQSSNSKPKFAKNINVGKHPSLMKAKRDKERGAPYKSNKKGRDEVDPMDPSAYSDVARGSWSSGLVTGDDAKTGVDTTANGPLFQQRPYPSPGDILRRNQAAKK